MYKKNVQDLLYILLDCVLYQIVSNNVSTKGVGLILIFVGTFFLILYTTNSHAKWCKCTHTLTNHYKPNTPLLQPNIPHFQAHILQYALGLNLQPLENRITLQSIFC